MSQATNCFYESIAWKECRAAYAASVGGLCEQCYAKGRIVPGEIVHHKIHLDPFNMHDPAVALNWDNLQLLCWGCHGKEHNKKRYRVDALGRVIIR